MEDLHAFQRIYILMLIVVVAIAAVWMGVSVLVWAACAASARADVEAFGPELARSGSGQVGERLTVWEGLPGLPVRDATLRPQGAR